MTEGLLGGMLGGEEQKPEVQAPEALAGAEAFAAAVVIRGAPILKRSKKRSISIVIYNALGQLSGSAGSLKVQVHRDQTFVARIYRRK